MRLHQTSLVVAVCLLALIGCASAMSLREDSALSALLDIAELAVNVAGTVADFYELDSGDVTFYSDTLREDVAAFVAAAQTLADDFQAIRDTYADGSARAPLSAEEREFLDRLGAVLPPPDPQHSPE